MESKLSGEPGVRSNGPAFQTRGAAAAILPVTLPKRRAANVLRRNPFLIANSSWPGRLPGVFTVIDRMQAAPPAG
jgi:hypothetical protein